ncbi:MOSC domain-containing protein [Aldersonia sp. NBC_00410]|uniref:MOSC domain-containing protein n=1 Tax=Aldersonia sp. NBC_00410 TaxID=2975954 RepID=UPI0022507417|nr:MOSC domain-containing protein [Aldersonia sp. NBC_00410]MCX5043436.1 MOSC domain-containing protein [Aldersonia sp. NBC_00410]
MSAPEETGRVDAVCVVHAEHPVLKNQRTAIDKQPVAGPVAITALGPAGDHVVDTVNHGGVDQAVYAYAEHEAARWAEELGRAIPPGSFGENLRISGMPVTDAVVGEQWQIGDTLLAVTAPRVPCAKFQEWLGEAHWVRRFTQRGDVGAYLRVLREGAIDAGDPVEVVHVPEHGITVRDLFTMHDIDRLAALLDEPNLSASARYRIEKALARAARA